MAAEDDAVANFNAYTDMILGVLTADAAVTAYGVVAGVGIAIGTVVKLGPRLFNFIWRFIDADGYGYANDGDDDYHEGAYGLDDRDY